jgi:membrane protein implicated in regulation of membrane protease activity
MSKDNRPVVFRGMTERITTMLWGGAVVAFGIGVIAWLQGYEFDLEIAGIAALSLLGLWILTSAFVKMARDDD